MSDTEAPKGSIEDRISRPATTLDAASTDFTPGAGKPSWADEVASPVGRFTSSPVTWETSKFIEQSLTAPSL